VTIGSDRKDLRLTFATVVNILLLLVQMAAKPFSKDEVSLPLSVC
jgi:hypothetical protein